jgi:hypothetical protein
VHVQVFALEIPVLSTSEFIWHESRPCLWQSCVVSSVVGSVFGEHEPSLFWISLSEVQVTGCCTHTSVTRKTAWCYHWWNTHCLEPQISLHAVCTLVMSLSVRKYNISAGKVTLLRLSTCKHRTTYNVHLYTVCSSQNSLWIPQRVLILWDVTLCRWFIGVEAHDRCLLHSWKWRNCSHLKHQELLTNWQHHISEEWIA